MNVENAIDCRQVDKRYPNFHLNHIDFAVPTGSVMVFVGPNGTGKSTTLCIITGLVRQDAADSPGLGIVPKIDILGEPVLTFG